MMFALRVLPGNGAPFIFFYRVADFSDKTDSVSLLHGVKITSVWSNVASMSQKQTIGL